MISLTISTLYEYRDALISWTDMGINATYRLERVFNGDFAAKGIGGLTWEEWESFNGTWQDFENAIKTWEQFDGNVKGITWEQFENAFPTWQDFENQVPSWEAFQNRETSYVIYEGSLTSYTDHMTQGAVTANYRLTVFLPNQEPETVTSGIMEIILNRPPEIKLLDKSGTFLGSVYKSFTFKISVSDPDPNNKVSFVARLDNSTLLAEQNNIQQNVPYIITIPDEQVGTYADNQTGAVTIIATDEWGATSTVTYTFTVIEDLRNSTFYYVMRDGEPIQKITSTNELNFLDYTAAGKHTYKIRAIDKFDNFVDSNELVLDLTIDYATLASISVPWDQVHLIQKRGALPTVARSLSPVFGKQFVTGYSYAMVEDEGFRESKWELSFTHRTLEDKNKVEQWAENGETVIYRDTFDNRIVGLIESVEDGYVFKNKSQTAIDFSVQINNVPYKEAVNYD